MIFRHISLQGLIIKMAANSDVLCKQRAVIEYMAAENGADTEKGRATCRWTKRVKTSDKNKT
jgi:hypothetical protein